MKSLASVFATGVRTPLGLDARSTTMMLRTGLAAIGAAPLDLGDGAAVTMAYDPTLDPYVVGDERAALLARGALAQLPASCAPGALRGLRTRVVLALPESIVGAPRTSGQVRARDLTLALREVFGDCTIDSDPRGSAGLAFALPGALAALGRREVEAVLVGGVHTDYDPEALRVLDAGRRLFRPETVDAVIPGESAAFVLLGRPDLGAKLGLRTLASIFGVSSEIGEITPETTAGAFDAGALASTFRQAAAELPAEIRLGWALGDHGLEHFRIREVYAAVTRTHSLFTAPFSIDSPAQRLGRTGAASLPLFIALAAESYRHECAPGPFGLLFAGSDRGERGAIVVSAP